ncbi:cell surface protein [Geminocystis sp. NIES-3708]|uniref:hypothetical protein n=1 Tax=Geminocystis sp. NIES-3708 TaxID=1615909 RepID=UPI0005FC8AB9|nr:hypothetical protein [Geminocystis sp. NIES-3708]BAQ63006.1 cell surface protein [Geminocystis sp. NIES-3708]
MMIQQLTNNDDDDVVFILSIRNDNIVWEDDDGHDKEIYFYDGNKIVQLSDNNFDDKITGFPIYSDTNDLIWTAEVSDHHGTYSAIYLYDGEKTIQITENIYGSIAEVSVNQNYIIWIANTYTESGRESNIYKYDQEKITKVTDNIFNYYINQLQISDDHIFLGCKR